MTSPTAPARGRSRDALAERLGIGALSDLDPPVDCGTPRTVWETTDVRIEPLTAERWDDLVALFGPSGAYSGCWCTWWRLSSKEFDAVGAEARRERLRARAGQEPPPGLLAYGVNDPGAVGWVSVAPVEEFPRILRDRKSVV